MGPAEIAVDEREAPRGWIGIAPRVHGGEVDIACFVLTRAIGAGILEALGYFGKRDVRGSRRAAVATPT